MHVWRILHHKGLTVFDFASARTQITGFVKLDHLPKNFLVTFLILKREIFRGLQVLKPRDWFASDFCQCLLTAVCHDMRNRCYSKSAKIIARPIRPCIFHFANIADLNWKVFVTQRKPIKGLCVFEVTSYFLSKYTENNLNKKERCLQISPGHCSEFTFFTFIIFKLSHGWYRWR